ncbi:MAG: hypothetical protein COA84_10930 [Robiginitomaculum sp.]|nr:MAG: hypothetical protein COA84_10930 [Robiginitomaculum sp.]
MADFRSHEEKRNDQIRHDKGKRNEETDARQALRRLEPQIAEYQNEVATLKAENAAIMETLQAQMKGVQEIKTMMLDRMDSLSQDVDQLHKKIMSVAENDLQMVQQMSDSQTARLEKLSTLISGGKND